MIWSWVSKHKSFILAGIITTVVGGLILYVIKEARNFFWSFLLRIWSFLFSDHTLSFSGWLWIIIAIPTFVGLFVAGLFVVRIISNKNNSNGDKYRNEEGIISGLKFRWKGSEDSIYGLQCFCPKCDYELTRNRNPYVGLFDLWTLPSCPGCGFTSEALLNEDLEDLIEREIERKKRSIKTT